MGSVTRKGGTSYLRSRPPGKELYFSLSLKSSGITPPKGESFSQAVKGEDEVVQRKVRETGQRTALAA